MAHSLAGGPRWGLRLLAVATLGAALFSLSYAEVYKCRGADGRTVISNTGCGSTDRTVEIRQEEHLSAEDRLRAKEDLDRAQAYVREQEQTRPSRADEVRAGLIGGVPDGDAGGSNREAVAGCLRDLDRQVLEPARRTELEANCRSRGDVPAGEAAIVYPGGNAVSRCMAGVERLGLTGSERSRSIAACRGTPVHGAPAMPAPQPSVPEGLRPGCTPKSRADRSCPRWGQ